MNMNPHNIKPNHRNWRQFCEETVISDEEYAEWLCMVKAVKADSDLYAALLVAVPGNRKPTVFGRNADDWSDVVAETDRKRRLLRRELAWWREQHP